MKAKIAALLSAALISMTAAAEIYRPQTTTSNEILHEIEVVSWSLKHSSMAGTIDNYVMDNSTQSLQRAREEVANGNLRTAREWVRKASQPLAHMDQDAMNGKHPDPLAYKLEIRDTLASLLPVAERIAVEKSASTDFIEQARRAMEQSDALLQAQQSDSARALLEKAYRDVQAKVAEMRSGDSFYLPTSRTASAANWLDGLNRIEERRAISRYLLIEAQSEGADTLPLKSGIQIAEATVDLAARLALEKQWERAIDTLELAYAQYETSWRAAGVDW